MALSGAGLAEILDPDGTIRVSSDPSRVGSRMNLGPSRADEGRAWFGDDDVDGVHSLVGQVPILSTNGDVLAVASVSERYPSVWELLSGAGERLLFYLGLGAALGLLASWLLSRRIKRHTRGLEVAEIAGLADHREALLHSIREGVVAVNNEGRRHAPQRQRTGAARCRSRRGGPTRRRHRARSGGRRVPALRRRRSRCRDRHPHTGFWR